MMISEVLFKKIINSISQYGLSPEIGKRYYFKDTIKQYLLDPTSFLIFDCDGLNHISVELKGQDYRDALFSDYYYGKIRIKEQINNLQLQVNNVSQISWVLVTAYYASFFMATEISKLCGKYIINFSDEDIKFILSQSYGVVSSDIKIDEPNYGYQVNVSHSENDKMIKLVFHKRSPRPHVEVWKNISEIVNQLDITDANLHLQTLFLNICNESNDKWHNPSRIRNDWNYKFSNYYGEKGNSLGGLFYKNIRKYSSTMNWAGNRTIQPHDENRVAGLSYIYHTLNKTVSSINDRINFDL
ncbi:hypothetical protein PZA22_18760 [Pectobacterium polaris]|uniref:hypothetical protein n=2 Tax=Pectobacterium polaris TaxID=2042057 RepID=UPI0023B0C9B0|nr:hypothetical protein [Pectobacterium polaris]MDE8756532.1 hypothetical protein [Pectobacterium polaris]MDG0801253.1 hypothetical protein [Pectobacterium polaris]